MTSISTKRLIIRVEAPEDATSLKALLEDAESRPFNEPVLNISIERMIAILTSHQNSFSTDSATIKSGKGRCSFSILNKTDKAYFGYTSINLCKHMDEVEISFGLKKEFWGKGIGTEAAQATLNFAFEQTNLPAIFAAVNPQNIASERILNRIGMQFLRKIDWPNQGLVNMYGINREQYLANFSKY